MKKEASGKVPGAGVGASADAAAGERRRDRVMIAIVAGFAAAALLVVAIMFPGYRFTAHAEAVERAVAAGDYERAIPHLQYIVKRYPEAYLRLRQLGDCTLAVKKPREARECYERALEAYRRSATPDSPEMNLDEELGICASELGDGKKAMEYFMRVLQERPNSPAANFYLGVQHYEAKHFREAAHCFQAVSADKKWDKKAEPYRRELARIVLEGNAAAAAAVPAPAPSPAGKR